MQKIGYRQFRSICCKLLIVFSILFLSGCAKIILGHKDTPDYSDIKKMEKLCEAGDLYYCTTVGNIYARGKWVDADLSKYYYTKACDVNYMEACYQHGIKYSGLRAYSKNHPWRTDPKRAISLIAKACHGDHAQACLSMAAFHQQGRGVEKNTEKAIFFYEKSCDLKSDQGSSIACDRLGDVYSKGLGVKQDLARASQKYRESCDIGGKSGCVSFGEINRLDSNETTSASLTRLYSRFCNAPDGEACNTLGRIFEKGWGAKKDIDMAADSYIKSCDAGFGKGCFNLGYIYRKKQESPVKMAKLFRKSCDLGYPRGCNFLAGAYYSGTGVPKDAIKVKLFNQRACDLDDHFCRTSGLKPSK